MSVGISAHGTGNRHRNPQGLEVERHIGGTTRSAVALRSTEDGHGRFRTDAVDLAHQIGVHHEVTQNEHVEAVCLLQCVQGPVTILLRPGMSYGLVHGHQSSLETASAIRRMASFNWVSDAA